MTIYGLSAGVLKTLQGRQKWSYCVHFALEEIAVLSKVLSTLQQKRRQSLEGEYFTGRHRLNAQYKMKVSQVDQLLLI